MLASNKYAILALLFVFFLSACGESEEETTVQTPNQTQAPAQTDAPDQSTEEHQSNGMHEQAPATRDLPGPYYEQTKKKLEAQLSKLRALTHSKRKREGRTAEMYLRLLATESTDKVIEFMYEIAEYKEDANSIVPGIYEFMLQTELSPYQSQVIMETLFELSSEAKLVMDLHLMLEVLDERKPYHDRESMTYSDGYDQPSASVEALIMIWEMTKGDRSDYEQSLKREMKRVSEAEYSKEEKAYLLQHIHDQIEEKSNRMMALQALFRRANDGGPSGDLALQTLKNIWMNREADTHLIQQLESTLENSMSAAEFVALIEEAQQQKRVTDTQAFDMIYSAAAFYPELMRKTHPYAAAAFLEASNSELTELLLKPSKLKTDDHRLVHDELGKIIKPAVEAVFVNENYSGDDRFEKSRARFNLRLLCTSNNPEVWKRLMLLSDDIRAHDRHNGIHMTLALEDKIRTESFDPAPLMPVALSSLKDDHPLMIASTMIFSKIKSSESWEAKLGYLEEHQKEGSHPRTRDQITASMSTDVYENRHELQAYKERFIALRDREKDPLKAASLDRVCMAFEDEPRFVSLSLGGQKMKLYRYLYPWATQEMKAGTYLKNYGIVSAYRKPHQGPILAGAKVNQDLVIINGEGVITAFIELQASEEPKFHEVQQSFQFLVYLKDGSIEKMGLKVGDQLLDQTTGDKLISMFPDFESKIEP